MTKHQKRLFITVLSLISLCLLVATVYLSFKLELVTLPAIMSVSLILIWRDLYSRKKLKRADDYSEVNPPDSI